MGTWSLEFPNVPQNPTDPRAPLTLDDPALSFTTDFTIEFWLRKLATDHSSNLDRYIIHKDHSTGTQWSVQFDTSDGDALRFSVFETAGGNEHTRNWTSLDSGTPNEWHHYAFTFDGNAVSAGAQMELYEDGVSAGGGSLVAGGLISNTFDSDAALRVGGFNAVDGSDEMKGYAMFDLRLWSDIRTGPEISGQWLTEQDPTAAGLAGNWITGRPDQRFAPPGGQGFIEDRTSNGNDLTLASPSDTEDQVREIETFPPYEVFFGTNHGSVLDQAEVYVNDLAVPSDGGDGPYIETDDLEAYVNDLLPPSDGEGPLGESPYIEHDDLEHYIYDAAGPFSWPVFDGDGIEAATDDIESIELGVTPNNFAYRMTGFDNNVAVNRRVYWTALEIDDDASEYGGSAGPVDDIQVHALVPPP